MLIERGTEIQAVLNGRTEGQGQTIRGTVLTLLGAFPTFGASSQTASQLAAIYVRALEGMPAWAVQDAAVRFIQGRQSTAWDPSRAPTPPQVVAEVKAVLEPVQDELSRISVILKAEVVEPVPPSPRSEEFDQHLNEAIRAGEMKRAGMKARPRMSQAEAEAHLESLRHQPLDGLKLSAGALEALERRGR